MKLLLIFPYSQPIISMLLCSLVGHPIPIKRGINLLLKAKVKNIMCYVLIGHTTHQENLHRILTLQTMGVDPFIMPLNKKDRYQKNFARWVNHKAIFKSVKWEDYKPSKYSK